MISIWDVSEMHVLSVLCLLITQMLHNMKGQFADHLMHAGFVSSKDPKDPKSNVNSGNEDDLGAC